MTLADRLAAIEARCAKATPGPWWANIHAEVRSDATDPDAHGDALAECLTEEDATLIAHARTDVPLLLAALRRAVKGLDEISRTVMLSSSHKHTAQRTDRITAETLADLARLLGEGEK